jgi:hypothetical protein
MSLSSYRLQTKFIRHYKRVLNSFHLTRDRMLRGSSISPDPRFSLSLGYINQEPRQHPMYLI